MLEPNKLAVLAPELAGITQITKRAASHFLTRDPLKAQMLAKKTKA
jgi:hypothetical protein